MSRGGAGHAQEECLEVSSACRSGRPSCPHPHVPTACCSGTPVCPSPARPATGTGTRHRIWDWRPGPAIGDPCQNKDQLTKGLLGLKLPSTAQRTQHNVVLCPCGLHSSLRMFCDRGERRGVHSPAQHGATAAPAEEQQSPGIRDVLGVYFTTKKCQKSVLFVQGFAGDR